MEKNVKSIILAAGKGTRMKSETPKVLHKIFNKELLGYVIDEVNKTGEVSQNYVIVGHKAEEVENFVKKTTKTQNACSNHPSSAQVMLLIRLLKT